MINDIQYNNKILTQQERVEFNEVADKFINTFSESIDGMYETGKYFNDSNNVHHKVSKIMCDISVFICYAYADCVVLTKLFMNTPVVYEKSLLRGKLKVHLNECFKKLYGFTEKAKNESYTAQLKEIMPHFHGPDIEFDGIIKDLEEISKRDSWWKEIRSAEVHIDVPVLYESRHEDVNESQVVRETMRLIPFFNRFNELLSRMDRAHTNYMFNHLSNEDKEAILANPELLKHG
jgi:hypothetical protein